MTKKNIYLSFFGVCCLSVFWISFPTRLPLIYETQSLIVNLNNDETDIVNQLYLLVKSPIYILFKKNFQIPSLFFISSILIEITITILIFTLIYQHTKNALSSYLSLILFSPLFHEVVYEIFGIRFLQSYASGIGWGSVVFSVRYIIGLFFIIGIFCYLKKKYYLGIFFVSLTLLTHPNSGFYIICMFLIYELYCWFFLKEKLLRLSLLLSLLIIFIIFTILKFQNIFNFINADSLSNSQWYFNMVRDEVDDFSVLWQLLYSPFTFFAHLTLIAFTSIFYFLFENNKSKEADFLIIFTFIPFLGCITFIIIEISLHLTNYILAPILIGMQPGHKLLSFSIFPLILFWSKYICKLTNTYFNYFKILHFFIISIFLVGLFLSINSIKVQLNYFREIREIKVNNKTYFYFLIKNSKFKYQRNPSVPTMYHIDNFIDKYKGIFGNKSLFQIYSLEKKIIKTPNEQFNSKYGQIEVFINLNNLIRENINENSGLIIPPYLFHIRDALPDYKIFFQEHHDGNLAMGGKKIYEEIDKRMKLLLGVNYTNLPPQQTSKLNFSYMRKIFLGRKEENFKDIKNNYDQYNYLITEISHKLNFDIVAKNAHYIIYKIN